MFHHVSNGKFWCDIIRCYQSWAGPPITPWPTDRTVSLKSASLFTGDLVEVNTNLVLFCFFKPAEDRPSQERCLILKFLHTRLLTQSEQFANELTRHLDICAPNCRILRQKVSSAMYSLLCMSKCAQDGLCLQLQGNCVRDLALTGWTCVLCFGNLHCFSAQRSQKG